MEPYRYSPGEARAKALPSWASALSPVSLIKGPQLLEYLNLPNPTFKCRWFADKPLCNAQRNTNVGALIRRIGFWGFLINIIAKYTPNPTLTYQNLQKSRVPINSILGFTIRTCKKVGFGRLR